MKIKPGDSVRKEIFISSELVESFSVLTGDDNPIHLSEEFAGKTIFKKRIAHGILSAGFISAIIAKHLPGPGSIYLSQNINFKSPVFIGETLIVSVEVISIREDKPIATLRTNGYVGEKLVVEGEAIVKFDNVS